MLGDEESSAQVKELLTSLDILVWTNNNCYSDPGINKISSIIFLMRMDVGIKLNVAVEIIIDFDPSYKLTRADCSE